MKRKNIIKTATTGLTALLLAMSPLQEVKAQKHEPRPRIQYTQSLNYQGMQPNSSQISIGALISTQQQKKGLNNGGTAYLSVEAMLPNKNDKIIGYAVENELLTNPAVFRTYIGSIGWFYETNTLNRNRNVDISFLMGAQQTFGKQYTQGLPQDISEKLTSWTGYTKIHAGMMFRFNDWSIGGTIGPILSSQLPKTQHPHRVAGVDSKEGEGTFQGFQATLVFKPNYEAIGEFFGNIDLPKRTPKQPIESHPMF